MAGGGEPVLFGIARRPHALSSHHLDAGRASSYAAVMKTRIRALLRASPFQPFVIRMADGREYRVDHPDFVLASSSDIPQVIIEEPDGQTRVLSVLLMTAITQAPVAAAAA